MSRLLFAAARGARIQRQHFQDFNVWEPSRLAWVVEPKDCDYTYRVHPDDEHLQYGPISSVLRGHAVKPAPSFGALGSVGHYVGMEWMGPNDGAFFQARPLHRSLFLLILADAIADEGM